jgi:phosphatidylserine/phosphatidylglycerophosphate/cardiolipin synthase-like enzyme
MFTTPALVYPDMPARRVPPPFERMLLADIDAARQSIDVALFEYDLASLSAALARAQQRGVAVRLALDRESLEHPDNARWAGDLQRVGVPVFWQESTAFLHSKFLIIDNAVVWAGSWNATSNGIYRNNNNLLRFSAPPLVANYAAEFAQMAQGSFGTRKQARTPYPVVLLDNMRVETYFSPQDAIEPRLLERVAAARHSIRFLAFSFTSDALADAMLARQVAGVQVQGVMERRSARGIGAEFARLRAGGADVWEDGNCYTMHHKVIIIDDATVITGSYNFTRRAEHTNDENLLIIDSPALAAQFAAEFERVYRQARNPPRCE